MSAIVRRNKGPKRFSGLILCGMVIAGCTTSSIDTALTPEPLPPAPESTAFSADQAGQARQTIASQAPEPQSFPNINNEPVGETAQLTAADQQAIRDKAARAQQSVEIADETAAYAARLKKLKLLARTHAQRTQKQIEGN